MSGENGEAQAGPRRSAFARVLRMIGLALLVAFAVGFLIGTLIRREAEKPVRYMGERPAAEQLRTSQRLPLPLPPSCGGPAPG